MRDAAGQGVEAGVVVSARWVLVRCCQSAGRRSDRDGGHSAQGVESAGEPVPPWPVRGHPQGGCPRQVHEPAGQVDELAADGAGDDEFVGAHAAEADGPAQQVVGQHGTAEPAALAKNTPEGQCSIPAPSFKSRMFQLDHSASPVVPVDLDRGAVQVRDEGMVAPLGPQPLLGFSVSRVRRTTRRTERFLRPAPVV